MKIILFWILLFLSGFVNAQTNSDTEKPDALQDVQKIQSDSVFSDTFLKIEILKRNLQEFENEIPEGNYLEKTSNKFEQQIEDYDSAINNLTESVLDIKKLDDLKDLERATNERLEKLDKLQSKVLDFTSEINTYRDNLIKLYEELNELASDSVELVNNQKLNEDYLALKEKLEAQNNSFSKVLGFIQKELTLLNDLKDIEQGNLETIKDVTKAKIQKQSVPIWESEVKDDILKRAWVSFKNSITNIFEYLKNNPQRIYSHLFIYLIILGVVLYFRGKKYLWDKYEGKEDEIKHVLHPIKRPYTSSLLLSITVTPWIHNGAPSDFFDAILILLLLPILIFVYNSQIAKLFRESIYFSIVYILIHLQHFVSDNTLFQRVTLLVLSVLLIYIVNRIKRIYTGTNQVFFKQLFKVAAFLIFISIIANILGYFAFAEFLLAKIASVLVLAAVFHIATFSVIDIIKLIMLTDRINKFNSVQKHYEIIKDTITKYVRFVALIGWILVVLSIAGYYDSVMFRINNFLNSQHSLGSISYTIKGVILFILTIYLSVKLSNILETFFKEDFKGGADVKKRSIGTITIMIRYSIIVLGFFFAIIFSGLPIENITIIAGALGVGIGFGLQNIFNNLVSGFILALEKPIQIGDIIQIDTFIGEVQDIGIRASKIKTFDGSEVIVPNGELISKQVVNWTHTDTFRRIEIFVGVAYGSPTEKVTKLLNQAVNSCTHIRSDPTPMVLFHDFGDNSINFRILCWTTIDNFLNAKSEITTEIDNLFRANNISIPFPQRDLHLRTVDPSIQFFKPEETTSKTQTQSKSSNKPD